MNANSLPKTTIENWLNESTKKLKQAKINSSRLDAELILSHVLAKNREWLLAHNNETLAQARLVYIDNLLERRLKHEPLAYILGYKEFYGRDFIVTPKVLIPRPESEDFIDLIKEIKPKTIVEIGAGSGCLAISAKLELTDASVSAVEIDRAALKVAKENAKKYRSEIKFLHGSLLAPLANYRLSETTIIANLPYVPLGLITSPEINVEPAVALFAGKDGLDVYRKFWSEIGVLTQKPQNILIESLKTQHKELQNIALTADYKLKEVKNLVQLFQAS